MQINEKIYEKLNSKKTDQYPSNGYNSYVLVQKEKQAQQQQQNQSQERQNQQVQPQQVPQPQPGHVPNPDRWFCTSCGTKNPSWFSACSNCGKRKDS